MNNGKDKIVSLLSATILLTYFSAIIIALFMPLQIDEVEYILLNHRAWIDNKHVITVYPQCGKQIFSQALPLVWYLPAIFDNFTYAYLSNPLWVRIIGIFQFLIWLALLIAIALRLFAIPRPQYWLIITVILAFLGLDALPLALQVNRPEQIMLIDAVLYVALALYAEDLCKKIILRAILTPLIFFVTMYTHAVHPKALVMLHLELFMGIIFLKNAWGSRAITLLGAGIIVWIGAQSYITHTSRWWCPASPIVQDYLVRLYLPQLAFWKEPLKFLSAAFVKITSSMLLSLNLHSHLVFSDGWISLSLRPLNPLAELIIDILDVSAWLMYMWFLLFSVSTCCRETVAWIRSLRSGQATSISILVCRFGLCAIMVLIAVLFLFTPKFFYAVSITVPLVLLASMFAIRLRYGETILQHPSFLKYAMPLMIAAIISQGMLFYRYEAFIWEPEAHETLITNRIMTMSSWGFDKKKHAISEVARQCDIDVSARLNHLVVDDVTYHVFRHTYEPLLVTYSTWLNKIFDVQAYFKILNEYQSDGVIGECGNFVNKLRPYTHEYNGFCCIPKATLNATHP